MRVISKGSVYVLTETSHDERHVPKHAGWRWHGLPGTCYHACKGCAAWVPRRVWWTADVARVAQLVAAAELERIAVEIDDAVLRTEVDRLRAAAQTREWER